MFDIFLPDGRIINIKITTLAKTFCIIVSVSMLAFISHAFAAIQVITMVAHSFRIMSLGCVRTINYFFLLTFSLNLRFLLIANNSWSTTLFLIHLSVWVILLKNHIWLRDYLGCQIFRFWISLTLRRFQIDLFTLSLIFKQSFKFMIWLTSLIWNYLFLCGFLIYLANIQRLILGIHFYLWGCIRFFILTNLVLWY